MPRLPKLTKSQIKETMTHGTPREKRLAEQLWDNEVELVYLRTPPVRGDGREELDLERPTTAKIRHDFYSGQEIPTNDYLGICLDRLAEFEVQLRVWSSKSEDVRQNLVGKTTQAELRFWRAELRLETAYKKHPNLKKELDDELPPEV